MTGRWAFIGHGALALALVGFAAACGADDDDDDQPNAGTGGAAGTSGTSGGGGAGAGAGAGGTTAGSGGSAGSMAMVTAAMCASNTKAETPMTLPACVDCVCGKPGGAAIIDKVGPTGWKLIECIGAKCDGENDATCIGMMCGMEAAVPTAIPEAMPTTPIFAMCMMECGIGDMGADAGM